MNKHEVLIFLESNDIQSDEEKKEIVSALGLSESKTNRIFVIDKLTFDNLKEICDKNSVKLVENHSVVDEIVDDHSEAKMVIKTVVDEETQNVTHTHSAIYIKNGGDLKNFVKFILKGIELKSDLKYANARFPIVNAEIAEDATYTVSLNAE